MNTRILLPAADGALEPYRPTGRYLGAAPGGPAFATRTAYAAAHVVADRFAAHVPGQPAQVDWDATLGYRRHLWSHGFAVADAMDTAQRNMGLDWKATEELIRRSAADAATVGEPYQLLACGAGTDHREPSLSVVQIIEAYSEQLAVVEDTGAKAVLMASRQLAAVASGPDDYHRVYGTLLAHVRRPVILHWLGDVFAPALAGYWGSTDITRATETALDIIRAHSDHVDGIKISLLDRAHEVRLRAELPPGVRLYTGDDFHYPELIRGEGEHFSHALLGIFDTIAPVAAGALRALDAGDLATYDALLAPTVPLSRHLFSAPTYHYKTGIVFLAWLAGLQDGFTMVNGAHSARSLPHLTEAYRLADAAGLLPDPDLALARMRALLTVAGVHG
ncbi:dihydrodipicolinate synthase family protein [Yinghuangia sp. ASG 101]|uniref:dihydrodipicolinate synthase family protein n=1 Tax=Yinghuangia sp. ASG 101 TaxID=2896848 RepID=UPI001E38B32C|nr:dihydrodipicolinate synthase family protein [Yinghuangia sp. ASG 101]UGQ11177.1 dihydrodipicolinate synthase family protein [Yinghuangia sp. ASG 101]